MPLRRALSIVLIFLTLGGAAAIWAQPKSPFTANGLGRGTIPIDGPWQFHLGDNPAWASPTFDDSSWEQLRANESWGEQGHQGYTGFAWYRRELTLSPAPGAQPDLQLLFGFVDDIYEVYWNGVRLGGIGTFPPHPAWPIFQQGGIFGIGPSRTGVLAVRVWKAPLKSFESGTLGGFYQLPLIGNAPDIAAVKARREYRWLLSNQLQIGLKSFYGFVGLLALLAWIRDRKQRLLLWFACFALAPTIRFFLVAWGPQLSTTLVTGIFQPLFGVDSLSLWFLLLLLFELGDIRFFARFTPIAGAVVLAGTSIDGLLACYGWVSPWHAQADIADAFLTALTTLLEPYSLVLVVAAVLRRRRLDPARWLVATFAFVSSLIAEATIALQQGSRFTHWTLGDKLREPLFTINGNAVTPALLANTLLLFSIVYAVYRYSAENRRRQLLLEQEFQNARELQRVLIPEDPPPIPGFALTSAYKPASEVGGDFFQIIPLESGETLIVLGDVSGKGLKAAMAVSLIVGAARMAAETTSNPAKILAALNRRLHGRLQGGFATCIALRLGAGGKAAIASAGHPSPFVNGEELELPGAFPLGLTPSADYEETALQLPPNTQLALYTDGLLEARNSAGELFGFDRMKLLFAANPDAAQAAAAAVAFGQDDDITVLTLKRLAAGAQPTAEFSRPRLVRA